MAAKINGKEIKYVTAELLMKDAIETAQVWQDQKDKVIYGLLKGVERRKAEKGNDEDVFILLSTTDKVTKVCNLDVFNILSFEVFDGIERDITFFRASKEDQDAAFEMVEAVISALIEAKRTIGDSGLIDVDSYIDLPKDMNNSEGPAVKTGVTKTYNHQTTHHHGHAAGHSAHHGTGYSTHNRTSYVTKEKEPTLFKRTSRKPTKAALEKMKAAVLSIAAGEYEPKIPKIKDDDKEDEKEAHSQKSPNAYGYDDDYYGGCC